MTLQTDNAKDLHNTLDFIGLRAHATTVGLVQLCMELIRAGVIDVAANERIKAAIHEEIMVSRSRGHDREEYAKLLKQRLDAIFPSNGDGNIVSGVGTVRDMEAALDPRSRN